MLNSERRQSDRVMTGHLDEIVLQCTDGRDAKCRIVDISPFGMCFEFSHQQQAPDVHRGDSLRVEGCPAELATLLLDKVCHIKWKQQAMCGAEFTSPLTLSLSDIGTKVEYTSF